MRVCAATSGFSTRRLGMSNGTLIADMPSSTADSDLAPAVKVELIEDAAVRCSQASALPSGPKEASRCSTETVWK
ncbi:hypothetical protein D3C81_2158490 [compost metagenome]